MTMNKSIDKMNIYQSKSLSDNKPGSQSDSSGFSGGSISMPSNSDPSISDHTMFPPIEDEESQRVSGYHPSNYKLVYEYNDATLNQNLSRQNLKCIPKYIHYIRIE